MPQQSPKPVIPVEQLGGDALALRALVKHARRELQLHGEIDPSTWDAIDLLTDRIVAAEHAADPEPLRRAR